MVTKKTTKGLVKVELWVTPKQAAKMQSDPCRSSIVGCQGYSVAEDSKE